MIKLIKGHIEFDDENGRPADGVGIVETVKGKIKSAHAALTGWEARFKSSDHEVRVIGVALTVEVQRGRNNTNSVMVHGKLQLQDSTNNDTFNGHADYVLILELESTSDTIQP